MDPREINFLNLENEILNARRRLNDLIYESGTGNQKPGNAALYQEKIRQMEAELQYMNNQLQVLKGMQNAPVNLNAAMNADKVPLQQMPTQQVQMPQVQISQVQIPTIQVSQTEVPQSFGPFHIPMNMKPAFRPVVRPDKPERKTQDYEKMFGKSFMGIFASVLIFISLIIFATLILPHLTDTIKLLGMYIVSGAVLCAGLLLYRKNHNNLFYIAIIGCGAGSLYLSLLLSNLYFKVFGDLMLYVLILAWAVFVKYLTRIKHFVFTIIGQIGIFIASVLGTTLCVSKTDTGKFFMLSIFYFISAAVFSNISKAYIQSLILSGRNEENGANNSGIADGNVFGNIGTINDNGVSRMGEGNLTNSTNAITGRNVVKSAYYENNLITHICKTLNVIVFVMGFTFITNSVYRHSPESGPSLLIVLNVLLFMGYLLFEFFFSYKEECRHGLVFQILTVINTVLLVCLFNLTQLLDEDWTFVFMYLATVTVLFYVEKKNAEYTLFSQICCLILIFTACVSNTLIEEHLYIYLTAVPFMLYGRWKKETVYLGAGIVYMAGLPFFIWPTYNINSAEALVMLAVLYGVFLYTSRKSDLVWFNAIGYIVLCLTSMKLIYDISRDLWETFTDFRSLTYYDPETSELKASLNEMIQTYSALTVFYVIAIVHLILSKLEYFGKDKAIAGGRLEIVKGIMLGINALLMFTGCSLMYITDKILWKLPVILITILLFFINSKNLLAKHKLAGFYIAFKYTVLMLCILGSYDVVDYATSICLLVFAIISIVAGFYKNTISFRLYGLVLSMISIVKLIMFDIKYDSTVENAISFFVSGVLCFVISFIYNRIDSRVRRR